MLLQDTINLNLRGAGRDPAGDGGFTSPSGPYRDSLGLFDVWQWNDSQLGESAPFWGGSFSWSQPSPSWEPADRLLGIQCKWVGRKLATASVYGPSEANNPSAQRSFLLSSLFPPSQPLPPAHHMCVMCLQMGQQQQQQWQQQQQQPVMCLQMEQQQQQCAQTLSHPTPQPNPPAPPTPQTKQQQQQ